MRIKQSCLERELKLRLLDDVHQGRWNAGMKGGSVPPALQERGQGQKCFLIQSTDIIFHIFFLLSFFSEAPSLLINLYLATKFNNDWEHLLVKSSPFVKILTRHYDIIISANTLFLTSAPLTPQLLRRP